MGLVLAIYGQMVSTKSKLSGLSVPRKLGEDH